MERWSDFSRLNLSGMPAPSSTVTVYLTGTQTLAQLYNSNSTADPKLNPFTAGTDGLAQFYAANGRYDIQFSGGGITLPWSLGDQLLFDPAVSGTGLWINPKDSPYNAIGNGVTDDTAAIQAALNAAKALGGVPVRFPAGTYLVTSTLLYETTADQVGSPQIFGSGRFATVFNNQVANGPLFQIRATVANTFQRGGHLKDFSILTTTNPVVSDGILVTGLYQCLFENVRIVGLTGDGVRIVITLGDADGPVQLIFERCWIDGNRGVGVDVETTGSAVENSFLRMQDCFVLQNFVGGVRYRGLAGSFYNTAFTLNGINTAIAPFGGLQGLLAGTSLRGITVDNCDFEHNGVCDIDLQSVAQVDIRQCEFLHKLAVTAAYPKPFGVRIASGGGAAYATNVRITNSFIYDDSDNYTQFQINTPAQFTRISGTRWEVWTGSNKTKISGTGLLPRIEDAGYDWPFPDSTLKTSLAGGSTYVPDLTQVKQHIVTVTTPGTLLVDTPIVPPASANTGLTWGLTIRNASGGAIVVTFGGLIIAVGYTNPGNGVSKSSQFRYDSAVGSEQWTPWV